VATVMERIQDIVADKLGVEKGDVVLDASFTDDLNADSLDLVELIMAFEEEFSTPENAVEITDDDAEGITTVEKAIDFLQSNGVKDE